MFFFIKERNQLFRTGPHLSSGAISVLHRPAELGALYGPSLCSALSYDKKNSYFEANSKLGPDISRHRYSYLKTLSSLKYPSWRVRTPHEERTNHTELSYGTHSGT
ncbi:uncharacterized protein LOC144338170 isoform X1 [Macaca mulatta]|nr:uncharacterized protein LOC105484898 [Macaca nemestrina]